MTDSTAALKLALWQRIAGLQLSVSHDSAHIERVEAFACQLMKVHGGDAEVIVAAAILHDLGRSDSDRKHGLLSIEASVEQARTLLTTLDGFTICADKIKRIVRAIDEHDQPEVTPSTIEGRILKDADFLAGFGAWGIIRIAMWSGETGRVTATVLEKIRTGMWRRFHSLEFPESRRIAQRELAFADMFLSELDRAPRLGRLPPGRYIVLEGISGTGKDTQAKLLKERIALAGFHPVLVQEPTDVYRSYRDNYETRVGVQLNDPDIMRELFVVDRLELLKRTVLPELDNGSIIVSTRSYLSTMVYQCKHLAETAAIALKHGASPHPDLLVLFDLEPGIAWERINSRKKEKGIHEVPGLLEHHRSRYLRLSERYFPSSHVVIDGSDSVEAVADRTWQAVEPILPTRSRA